MLASFVAAARPRAWVLPLAFAVSACGSRGGARAPKTGAAHAAPTFTGTRLDGEAFDLAKFEGSAVLLNVWATWCQPCRDELPELAGLHRHYHERGFSVVGVSVDQQAALPRVQAMVEEFNLPYPVVFDPSASVVEAFSVGGYPTSFLIDPRGKVQFRRNGLIAPGDGELTVAIERALAPP